MNEDHNNVGYYEEKMTDWGLSLKAGGRWQFRMISFGIDLFNIYFPLQNIKHIKDSENEINPSDSQYENYKTFYKKAENDNKYLINWFGLYIGFSM
jgi:hypothetical protein